MATEQLSTEIVNQGVKDSGPYAGSLSFSVRVRRGLPDFLNSVNLKYVKLGYSYLISHRLYFLTLAAPVVIMIFGAEMKKVTWEDICNKCDLTDVILAMGLFVLTLYIYLDLTPRSIYLVDFACYRPPNELKTSKQDFIKLAKESGHFDDAAIEFQQRILKYSGIGDESYMPRSIFRPDHQITIKDGREEAALVMFGAIDDVLRATKIKPADIKILIVNCGILNTTPSLSAMVINHYKLKLNVQSYNLGGMGCSAGVIAIDLAKDLLIAYPGSYALVVSTEVVSSSWYTGKEHDMLIPNCFFRMGAAALLLSSGLVDRWRSKYELKQVVRIHKGMENRSFKSIQLREDKEGKKGLSVSKDVVEIGVHALKANITTLGPLVLPISEQLQFFTTLLFKKKTTKPYIPDYKLAFEHVCVLPTSKKVLDEIQNNLELTQEYMEAARKTLERFGNTSSSGIWYELAYLEAESKIKRGHRICQIACGSGFKCNSAVWTALRNVGKPKRSPWIEDSTS